MLIFGSLSPYLHTQQDYHLPSERALNFRVCVELKRHDRLADARRRQMRRHPRILKEVK